MTGRDDSEGYEPHPGDPWHPNWKDPSAEEADADLFDVPEPEGDEDRARFFRRLLRRDSDEESEESMEEGSSVDHLYDTLRSPPEPEGEADEEVSDDAVPVGADDVAPVAAQPVTDVEEAFTEDEAPAFVDTAFVDTGEIESAEDTGEVEVAAAFEIAEVEPMDTPGAVTPIPEAAVDDTPVVEVSAATDEIPEPAMAEADAVADEELVETLGAVSFEAESVPVAQVEWDLREYEAVPTAHLEAMRQLEDGLLEAALDLEDAALTDELASAAAGLDTAQREASVTAAIARERMAESAALAHAREMLDSESARITEQVRTAAVAGARATELQVAGSERERFEVDLREQRLVAAGALTAAGTADAIERGSSFEAEVAQELAATDLHVAIAERARSQGQLVAAQSTYHAANASAGEDLARSADIEAEVQAIQTESDRADAAVGAAAEAHAETNMVAASLALQARLDHQFAEAERDALDREFVEASAPAFYLDTGEPASDTGPADELAEIEDATDDDEGLRVKDLAPVFAVSAVVPRKRRWWQRLFGRDKGEPAEELSEDQAGPESAEGVEILDGPREEETTGLESTALAFAGMAADPPDRTEDSADETGELDQPELVPAEPDAGFEGWLDPEEVGEAEAAGEAEPAGDDAYAGLAEDDAEAEIAGWVAFTQGDEGEEGTDQPPDVTDELTPGTIDEGSDEETAETDAAPESDTEMADATEAGDDDEEQIPAGAVVGAEAALTDHSDTDVVDEAAIGADWDVDHFVGDDPTDEHEFDEAVMPAPTADTDEELADAEIGDDTGEDIGEDIGDDEPEEDTGELAAIGPETDDHDDTGELDIVGVADSPDEGDEVDKAGAVAAGVAASAAVFDFDDFTEEDYVQTATSDHAGLAEAMAEAGDEPTEQVALAADMPGLESGVVSFDDVVESEDVYAGATVSPRSDLLLRVLTAVVLIGAFAASLLWRPALIALAIVVFILAAGEFYTALMQRGYQPIALFGFLAIAGAGLGTVVWGVIAIPSSLLLATTILLLFLAVVPRRRDAMLSLGLTITVAAWIGGLGSFAFDIIEAEDYRTLVLAVVVTVAVVDIAQYFVGRAIGRHQMAPVISPKKTIEGLAGGVVVAFLVGASLHFFPPFDLASGLAFGAVVAVFAPMGDLAVSAAKRSLDLKDMGSILPGHGGFLDRIDSLIFVIPAAWVLFTWLGYL